VTGGGQITSGGPKVSFGFNVQTGNGTIKGQLEYNNHAAKTAYHSIQIADLRITPTVCPNGNGKQAEFEGTVRQKNTNSSCAFRVVTKDCGEPGRNDYFEIEFMGCVEPGRSGTLDHGNIQVH
jgi:hypothetical protein